MHRTQKILKLGSLLLILTVLLMLRAHGQSSRDALESMFLDPPDSAKPRVWWHWMNGNITKEGIKLDLEWMKRVGIGGFQNYDASLKTTKFVDKRLVYMTPEWKDAFQYATNLADQLGLEEAIAGSPGWSESGGPWVKPSHGMKKLVWSATFVQGGVPFSGKLPKPPSTTGPYQNIPLFDFLALIFALGGPVNPFQDVMGGAAPGPDLEASEDGVSFRKVSTIPNNGARVHTISFPETTARFYRVTFTSPPPFTGPPAMQFDADFGDFNLPPSKDYAIAELALHAGPRVNRVEEKAAFATLTNLYAAPTPHVAAAEAVAKSAVVDLTSKMRPDGSLDWTPPAGRWVVMRFGYSLLGITNHPASPEGTGLEVDKLNPDYVREYMNTYLDNYKSAVGPLMGKRGLQYVINDSWEAGTQNWTDNLIAEFTKRRGYDPRPWMAVLAGRVIESSESSDRFLWDFRLALSDMLAEYHYDLITAILKERSMGHYGESHEEGRAFIGDGMQVKRSNTVPMSATWTQTPGVNKELYGYNADVRESASVAHLYGQNLVAAESLTAASGAWAWSPATLKPTADKELAMGLNRFVIHTSVHQPLLDKKPGLALGPFGQWFTRNETWAEQAKPWVTYLARNSYLLQQGRFVADVVYFYGEDSNITALFGSKSPELPSGYNFDYINADALVHLLTVENGELATSSGMRYRVLALDPFSQHMSLPVLRKIRDVVQAGAVVCGPKPLATPSLSDDTKEFQSIVDLLWGPGGAGNQVGKGKVYGTQELRDVLASLKVAPD